MNFGFRPRVWHFEGPDELLEGLEFRVSGGVEGFIGFFRVQYSGVGNSMQLERGFRVVIPGSWP